MTPTEFQIAILIAVWIWVILIIFWDPKNFWKKGKTEPTEDPTRNLTEEEKEVLSRMSDRDFAGMFVGVILAIEVDNSYLWFENGRFNLTAREAVLADSLRNKGMIKFRIRIQGGSFYSLTDDGKQAIKYIAKVKRINL